MPSEYPTIQQAINAAEDGDVIWIDDGIYQGDGNRDLFIDKAITLKSKNGSKNCIIDCQGSREKLHRGMYILLFDKEDPVTVIEGFTIVNGFVNTDITAPILGFVGGGILCHTDDSSIIFRDCIVKDCQAPWFGGGIYIEGQLGTTKSYITSCILQNNFADKGGGLATISGLADIRNTIIAGNNAKIFGGGVYLNADGFGERCEILNCTIVDNHARSSGGGLYFDESAYSDQTWIRNSIIRGNLVGAQTTEGIGPQLSFDYQRDNTIFKPQLKIAYCNIEDITTGIYAAPLTSVSLMSGNIDVAADFTSDYRLTAGSLCIDQGDPDNSFPGVAQNRLSLHLKLNQETGDQAFDSSDHNHSAILFGDKQWQPQAGYHAGALNFDGFEDFITVNDVTNDLTGENVTLTGWIKTAATTGEQAIFSLNAASGPAKLIVGRSDNTQNLQIWYRENWHDTGIVTFDDNWHFIACVLYDDLFRHRIIIYVDGKRESIFNNTQVAIAPDDLFSIGQAFNHALYPDRFYNGLIDEIRIYQTPLKDFAINYLYADGAILSANDQDIDLEPRIAGSQTDIGAYEFQNQRYELITITDGDGLLFPSSANYGAGKVVQLTAIPYPNSRIKKWLGTDNDNSTEPLNTVTMDQNKTAIVVFEPLIQYSLNTQILGQGAIAPTSGAYWNDTVVQLKATPAANWRLKSWSGTDNDLSTQTVNTVTIDQNKTVTVEFELIPQYHLTVEVAGNGEIDPQGGLFKENTVVELTALPATGHRIKNWSGTNNDLSTENKNTVTVNSDRTVTVTFEPISFQLTTLVRLGQGQVTPTSGLYEYGSVVTLNTTAADCFQIKQWLGTDDDSSKLPTNTVTIDSDKTVTVDFELIRYQLDLDVVGGHGTVKAIPKKSLYSCDTLVTLQANPAAGYQVKSWSGTDNDNDTTLTNSVSMNADKTIRVEFQPTAFTLTTNIIGGSGFINPSQGTFPNGSVIDLLAVPATFYRVKRWQGANDDDTRNKKNQVKLDSDKMVLVEFEPTQKIPITKITVNADQRTSPNDPITDTIEIQGSFDLTENLAYQAQEINLNLLNPRETILTETFPLIHNQIKNGIRYSYSQNNGTIKSFKFDLKKQNFSISLKKVDLTGLTSPLMLELHIGDYFGVGLAADEYQQYLAMGGSGDEDNFQDVINRRRPIPILLMQGYADTLHVKKAKLKHRKKQNVDSLVIQGNLTTDANQKWNALISEGLTVSWGIDDYTETVEPGKFIRVGGKYLFKNNKNQTQTIQSAIFDKVKCTFKIVIDNTQILSRIGPVDLEISFGDYNQVDKYILK
ncbi:MAG: hypothetical protein GY869_00570 [Planctomycetes bacterium]|nr:hypothetical protein [Planctomycetota bacterium]